MRLPRRSGYRSSPHVCACIEPARRYPPFDEDSVMPVSREVILDLLPLYLAGEASPASRQLVEEFVSEDPRLAELVQRGELTFTSQLGMPAPAASLELRALARARF